jgi:hypothetical protein
VTLMSLGSEPAFGPAHPLTYRSLSRGTKRWGTDLYSTVSQEMARPGADRRHLARPVKHEPEVEVLAELCCPERLAPAPLALPGALFHRRPFQTAWSRRMGCLPDRRGYLG